MYFSRQVPETQSYFNKSHLWPSSLRLVCLRMELFLSGHDTMAQTVFFQTLPFGIYPPQGLRQGLEEMFLE